jgi:hypothetical protein
VLAELRRLRRREISRLRALSVDVSELSVKRSRAALSTFVEQFVAPEQAAGFLAVVEAARASHREVDYARWMRQDGRPPQRRPRLRWLSAGREGATCLRFDPRVVLQALRLSVDGMQDVWAFSWPGAYVSFDDRRAMVVSIDYEVTCCDLSAAGASPYR